jgi:hypothetical protein
MNPSPTPPRDQVTDRKREVRFMDHVSRYSAFLEQGVDALSFITGQLLLADGSLNRGLS